MISHMTESMLKVHVNPGIIPLPWLKAPWKHNMNQTYILRKSSVTVFHQFVTDVHQYEYGMAFAQRHIIWYQMPHPPLNIHSNPRSSAEWSHTTLIISEPSACSPLTPNVICSSVALREYEVKRQNCSSGVNNQWLTSECHYQVDTDTTYD